jgi:pantetheine-phosphate adenylyltransferase
MMAAIRLNRCNLENYAVKQSWPVFYPGSFDPVTLGHLDLIARASRLFDRVVVGVGIHHGKSPLFSGEERMVMLHEGIAGLGDPSLVSRVHIITFDQLAVTAATACGAVAILRGVRDISDIDYELRMATMNATLAPGLETVFLPGSLNSRHITATFVRQIAQMGGDISPFVPACVVGRMREKLASTRAS